MLFIIEKDGKQPENPPVEDLRLNNFQHVHTLEYCAAVIGTESPPDWLSRLYCEVKKKKKIQELSTEDCMQPFL